MGDPKAFLNIPRQEAGYRPISERITDYSQVEQTLNTNSRKLQASRCMDCGVPFCHWACPIGNKQPEWQDALYKGKWKKAGHWSYGHECPYRKVHDFFGKDYDSCHVKTGQNLAV